MLACNVPQDVYARKRDTLQNQGAGMASPIAWTTALMLAPPGSPLCPVPTDSAAYKRYRTASRTWNELQSAGLPRGGPGPDGVPGGFCPGESNDEVLYLLASANHSRFGGVVDAARAAATVRAACGSDVPVADASVATPFNVLSLSFEDGRIHGAVQSAVDLGRRLWQAIEGRPNAVGYQARVAL